MNLLSVIYRSERGATLMEWALVVSLIAIVALVGVVIFGREVSSTFSTIADSVVEANS